MNSLRAPQTGRKPVVTVQDPDSKKLSVFHLPGASTYRVANAIITTKRKALNLQEPFELSFDNWGPGNPVHKWYKDRPNRFIQTMHLRKERKAPFYHEFIVFQLRDNSFWRIDRRQLPTEPEPVRCIREGVTAYDTIEQVTGMNSFLDPILATASDCMVELEFKKDVDVGLVLRICHAIRANGHSKLYTLQRYNCFFFAQTLIMCTACGASDWAGWGGPREDASHTDGPWKTPNTRLGDTWSSLNNAEHLRGFDWNPSESFNRDWGMLSQQSNALVHASPLLRHADHCNYCLESQSKHRQRSLSSEINRLKHELGEYWNKEYRQLLNDAYRMNHEKFVESGLWAIIRENSAKEDCEAMLPDKVASIKSRWDGHAEGRLEKLLSTVQDLIDPTEVCDAWYPDPDEWKSTWTCKDGGPVKAAMDKWQEDMKNFIKQEFANLKEELETQTIQSSYQVHMDAIRRRMESFEAAMTIKLRDLDEEELTKPIQPEDAELPEHPDSPERALSPDGALKADHRSVFSERSKRSIGTFLTGKMSKMTKRATQIKNRTLRIFKRSHKLEPASVIQLEKRIEAFIIKHGNNVEVYKRLLNCTSEEVQNDMKQRMNDVWDCVVR